MTILTAVVSILLVVSFATPSFAGCSGGPGCPMCTGRVMVEVPAESCERPECPVLSPGQSSFFTLYAPETEEKGVSYLRFGVLPRLEAGIGYAWSERRALGSVNYLLRPEDSRRPALTLGVGSRRTGGSDSSAFLSATRSVPWGRRRVRLSLGLAHTLRQSTHAHHEEPAEPMPMAEDPMAMADEGSQDHRRTSLIAGVALPLGGSTAAALQYDGESVHALLTGRLGPVNAGLMLFEMRDLAAGVSYVPFTFR